ncbi:MAG: hypothetical protein WBB01_01505 [Phormidesmis sp.]
MPLDGLTITLEIFRQPKADWFQYYPQLDFPKLVVNPKWGRARTL